MQGLCAVGWRAFSARACCYRKSKKKAFSFSLPGLVFWGQVTFPYEPAPDGLLHARASGERSAADTRGIAFAAFLNTGNGLVALGSGGLPDDVAPGAAAIAEAVGAAIIPWSSGMA